MKVLFVSDFDMRGSGYFNIAAPLCSGLSERGHEVKALGLGYNGEEHWFDFSIIPARTFQEVTVLTHNLNFLWKPDVVVVALDVPLQETIIVSFMQNQIGLPYVGIMPVEADPLCVSWAMIMMQMSKAFIISEFGTQEAKKAGVDAKHLQVGVDLEKWALVTEEERQQVRKGLGIDNKFVVLTVADNQERKNLSRSMEIVAKFAKEVTSDVVWLLVTREQARIGWRLRDYADELAKEDRYGPEWQSTSLMIFERGLPHDELLGLFHAADIFLLTSKAEGLGMPIIEAMATGLPVAATNCTAISDHLLKGRGLPIDYEYEYRDPFGNGNRYFASLDSGLECLKSVYAKDGSYDILRARKYVSGRNWEETIEMFEKELLEVTNAET